MIYSLQNSYKIHYGILLPHLKYCWCYTPKHPELRPEKKHSTGTKLLTNTHEYLVPQTWCWFSLPLLPLDSDLYWLISYYWFSFVSLSIPYCVQLMHNIYNSISIIVKCLSKTVHPSCLENMYSGVKYNSIFGTWERKMLLSESKAQSLMTCQQK